jgi:hypothetical protein
MLKFLVWFGTNTSTSLFYVRGEMPRGNQIPTNLLGVNNVRGSDFTYRFTSPLHKSFRRQRREKCRRTQVHFVL